MVTYSDLIQTGILIIGLIDLVLRLIRGTTVCPAAPFLCLVYSRRTGMSSSLTVLTL